MWYLINLTSNGGKAKKSGRQVGVTIITAGSTPDFTKCLGVFGNVWESCDYAGLFFAKRELKDISRDHSALPFCILPAVSAACPTVLITLFAMALVPDVCNASNHRLSLLKWQLGIRHPNPGRFAGLWHHCKTLPWWCFWCCDSLLKARNPGCISLFLFAIYNKTWFVLWQFLISAEPAVPS